MDGIVVFALLAGPVLLVLPMALAVIALIKANRVARVERNLEELSRSLRVTQKAVADLHNLLADSSTPTVERRRPAPAAYAVGVPEADTPARPEEHLAATPDEVAAPTEPEESPTATPDEVATPTEPEKNQVATPPTDPVPASASPSARAADKTSLEELLAGNVFLKIGVAFVVIGVASLLGTAILSFGPQGKVAVGYAIGGAMLGLGFFAERRQRYRAIGRAVLAGAWGLLYFVAFAMHFIPQAQLIDSELGGIVALLVAAAGAVAFSLRYDSERTTFSAFLLIYLTLALAAWKLEATFNLVSTTIVGAGLAFLAWRKHWDRLLTIGMVLTWVVFAAWIVPSIVGPGTLDGRTSEPSSLPALTVPLAVTWAAFQAVVLWRHHQIEPRQTWLVAGFLANAAGGFALIMFVTQLFAPAKSWIVAVIFGLLYILGAWTFRASQRRVLFLISGTIGLLALGLVTPLRLGLDSHWIPMSRILGLEAVLAAGIFLRERYFRFLAYLLFAFTFFVDLAILEVGGGTLEIAGAELESRLPLFTVAVVLALANVILLRRPWRRALTSVEVPAAPVFFSVSAALLLLLLLWLDLPDTLVAPATLVAALVGLAVARFLALRDFAVEAAVYAVATLVAVVTYNLEAGSTLNDRAWRVALLATCGGLACAGYALGRWRTPTVPGEFRRWLVATSVTFSLVATVVFTLLVFYDAPGVWLAPFLVLLVATWVALSLRFDLPELLFEGLALTVVAVFAVVSVTWGLDERFLSLPERLVSVALVLAALFVTQWLLERHLQFQRRELSARERSFQLALTVIYLALPTLLFVALVKAEALAWDKNLLVALIWGVVALLYLEVALVRRSRPWLTHGHLLMAAALVHLFLVNFVQLGSVGPLSLRVVTVTPFLGFLLYAFNTWDGTTKPIRLIGRVQELRHTYLYSSVAVAATLLAYELWRAWVIVAWGALAILLLLRWRRGGNTHWRLSALGLGIAAVARGIGVNLYYRDEIGDFPINPLSVPLTAAALLAGYLMIRLAELRALPSGNAGTPSQVSEAPGPFFSDGQRFLDLVRRHGMIWLLLLLVLVTGFLWVETSGPIFTICLSLEGLGLIGLGIAVRERWARLAGLLTLVVCVVKLFADLFGMEGVPGWVPFLGVGVVLLAVAFGYTRFSSRLKELIE